MLKLFHASFSQTWSYGGYEYEDCIVCANTEEEALGLVLEHKPDSQARYWSITELDTTKVGVEEISSSSS